MLKLPIKHYKRFFPFIFKLSDEKQVLNFTPKTIDIGERLDVFLSKKVTDWSRSKLKKLIGDGSVLVNRKVIKPSHKLRENDEVKIEFTNRESDSFEPENISLDIVFEDEHLAIINKPAGMVVHPGAGISSGTLANAVAYHFYQKIDGGGSQSEIHESTPSEIARRFSTYEGGGSQPEIHESAQENRVGIVHRLDKNTSGLILVAKNQIILDQLAKQFKNQFIYKSYVALVHGFTRRFPGKIVEPIARDRKNRLKMSVNQQGRNAYSAYRVRQRFERYTLLDVQIKTGRTHQIRVHLAHMKHPVVGDNTYNEGRDKTISDVRIRKAVLNLNRFFLHAEKLSFTHPVSKEKLDFVQPIPHTLQDLLSIINT